MVVAFVVLGGILTALATTEVVSGRTMGRSADLRHANLGLQQVSRDVRAAYAVAPADPASTAADGVSVLVQQGSGAAEDPRVWVTYRCSVTSGRRTCSRGVGASPGAVTSATDLFRDLVVDERPVFSVGWPADPATCTDGDCTTWTRPSAADPRLLDGRYVRSAEDRRPPVVRVQLRIRSTSGRAPIAMSTTVTPRGCVDPSPSATPC